MTRRSIVTAIVTGIATIGCVSGVTACGDSPGPTGAPEPSGNDYPTDPVAAVVRIGDPRGFPSIVIGGDGWVYRPSDEVLANGRRTPQRISPADAHRQPSALPAPPRAMPVSRSLLSAEGLRTVLDLGERLGLFEPAPDYADVGVTDASTTSVTLVDAEGTYVHEAYALGDEGETGDRRSLADFVAAVEDIATLVGTAELGPPEAYVPAVFDVVVAGPNFADATDPRWPVGVPVVEGCHELPVEQFGEGVAGTYSFEIDGRSTLIEVIPDLPGDRC